MRLILIALCALLLPSGAFCADQEMTMAELARHLGISTWRIPADQLPDSYKVTLHHIKDGRLTKDYVLGQFKKHGDLLICTHWLSDAASVSVDDGKTMYSTKAALSSRPVFATQNHFQGLDVPLLLCYRDPLATNGDEWKKGASEEAQSMDYSKARSGLAIVISNASP